MSTIEKPQGNEPQPESEAGWTVVRWTKNVVSRIYDAIVPAAKPQPRRRLRPSASVASVVPIAVSGAQAGVTDRQMEQRAAEVKLSDIVNTASNGVPAVIGDPKAGKSDKRSFNEVWSAPEIPGEASEEKDVD